MSEKRWIGYAELAAMVYEAKPDSFGGKKKAAKEAVEAVFDVVMDAMHRGETVALTGFGTFRPVVVASRERVNPRTGGKVVCGESVRVAFKASKVLNQRLSRNAMTAD